MGLFEALFDFNGDGKVDLDDDLLLTWIIHQALDQKEETPDYTSRGRPYVATVKAEKKDAKNKLQQNIYALRQELYAICLPCSVDKKDGAKEAIEQYKALLRRLDAVMPEDDGSRLYFEYLELDQEIKNFLRIAEKVYQILNGEYNAPDDPVATKATEIAALEQELTEWEMSEPKDAFSEAWNAWERKRQEYEDEIAEQKEELDWDRLFASFDAVEDESSNQDYLAAYNASTAALQQARLSVEKLEQLTRVAKRILQEVGQTVSEQIDALSTAELDLALEEPEKTSPKWESWHSRIDELQQLSHRLDQIDYI